VRNKDKKILLCMAEHVILDTIFVAELSLSTQSLRKSLSLSIMPDAASADASNVSLDELPSNRFELEVSQQIQYSSSLNVNIICRQ